MLLNITIDISFFFVDCSRTKQRKTDHYERVRASSIRSFFLLRISFDFPFQLILFFVASFAMELYWLLQVSCKTHAIANFSHHKIICKIQTNKQNEEKQNVKSRFIHVFLKGLSLFNSLLYVYHWTYRTQFYTLYTLCIGQWNGMELDGMGRDGTGCDKIKRMNKSNDEEEEKKRVFDLFSLYLFLMEHNILINSCKQKEKSI